MRMTPAKNSAKKVRVTIVKDTMLGICRLYSSIASLKIHLPFPYLFPFNTVLVPIAIIRNAIRVTLTLYFLKF